MSIVGSELGELIMRNMREKYKSISGYDPIGPQNPKPHFFVKFCMGIGKGIATGTPSISFKTIDVGAGGAPAVNGSGIGKGIKVNSEHMSEMIYTKIRNKILQTYGKTNHGPWPVRDESGVWLKAMTDSIAEAIKEHYGKSIVLSSSHPLVYIGTGKIMEGGFSGIKEQAVTSAIISETSGFNGGFWPTMAQQISLGYIESIHKKATGIVTITGTCSPGESQVCGIPVSGAQGSGVAS